MSSITYGFSFSEISEFFLYSGISGGPGARTALRALSITSTRVQLFRFLCCLRSLRHSSYTLHFPKLLPEGTLRTKRIA
jgi:hypothetical protein